MKKLKDSVAQSALSCKQLLDEISNDALFGSVTTKAIDNELKKVNGVLASEKLQMFLDALPGEGMDCIQEMNQNKKMLTMCMSLLTLHGKVKDQHRKNPTKKERTYVACLSHHAFSP